MMWAALLGTVIVLVTIGWLAFIAPTRRLVRYLHADERGIRVGRSDIIRWTDLREVNVETTAAGPWSDDFFLVLVADGRRSTRIPEPLIPIVLPSVQQLPNFNNDALIRAVGSVHQATFRCWSCEPSPDL
jgi:hypothetical protein